MKKNVLSRGACLSVVLLSACGGTGQDDGSISTFEQTLQGRSIDGYLARSLVFLDSNNNGTRDAWEPRAFTDNDGYFSYNPLKQRNYCSDDASDEEQQYCLKTHIEYENVILRIDGGYDVSTGEPFLGQLSRSISLSNTPESILVTPLSSLLSSLPDSEDQTQLLAKLNLSDDALELDYFDLLSQSRPDLININLKVHKIITILDDFLVEHYSSIGDEFGTPNDSTVFVYRTLAEKMMDFNGSAVDALTDQSVLTSALYATETYLKGVYTTQELSAPASLTAEAVLEKVAMATDVAGVVDRLINPQAGALDEQALLGAVRVLEVITAKAVNRSYTSGFDNAIAFFNSPENTMLVQGLVNTLSESDFNLPALFQSTFSGSDFSSLEALQALARLGSHIEPFKDVAGQQIKVSDRVKDTSPSDLEDKEFEFYFHGEAGDTSGAFTACAKFIDGASRNTDGTLSFGEGNVEGERVHGFWSLLGANASNNYSSYSLLLTINFLGTTYQTVMKPASESSLPTGYSERIRFDTSDGIVDWFSESGLETINFAPDSHADCRLRLGSRLL